MASTVDDWMYNHEQYVQQQENFLGQISGAIITIMDENRRLHKEVERLKEYETRFNDLVKIKVTLMKLGLKSFVMTMLK